MDSDSETPSVDSPGDSFYSEYVPSPMTSDDDSLSADDVDKSSPLYLKAYRKAWRDFQKKYFKYFLIYESRRTSVSSLYIIGNLYSLCDLILFPLSSFPVLLLLSSVLVHLYNPCQ